MINELAQEIHKVNVKNGFYEDEKNIGEMIALIHSELSEMLEADRKGREFEFPRFGYTIKHLMEINDNDKFKHYFESQTKDTFEDELADSIIRLLDLAAFRGIDIEGHIKAKLRYNSLRPYKHGKRY